ncbi:hypothetical protein DO97_03025 [Neosynechococcus sphagnicola sy1]|uniref:UPF0182 protein DO97_03025 n=1 Tax=Neosynechococcus sphagnicola sy1 TaxID=1497020 RepID=A0A098TME3_9CYAN|nr:UPF0182 family protein [Neosynechococcus sphagnicola]KGF73027.1 hypothetical protein DO97_03025 [Neosynechococcus sphagnicola sy1]
MPIWLKSWRWLWWLGVLLLGLWVGIDLIARFLVEIWWFQEVGYLPVLWRRLQTQAGLWTIATGITAVFLLGNLVLAHRWHHPSTSDTGKMGQGMGLGWLLPLTLVLGLVVGMLLFHNAQIAASYWHPDPQGLSPPLASRLRPGLVWQMVSQFPHHPWQPIVLAGLAIALVVYPHLLLWAIALILSLGLGWLLSEQWMTVLQSLHPTDFGQFDPVFNRPISFYVFKLPLGEVLTFWWVEISVYGFVSTLLIYLLSRDSLSQGRFPGFSGVQQRHLSTLGSILMLSLAVSYGLSRYELLFSGQGVLYGASFTDLHVNLPIYTLLSLLAGAIALVLGWRAGVGYRQAAAGQLLALIGAYWVMAGGLSLLVPSVIQRLVVQPNELAQERPYLQRSIALTRRAFALDAIEAEIFTPKATLTPSDLQANHLTIDNIRLWDTRPLLATNRQLQQIRPYYQFPDADIDRYILQEDPTTLKAAINQQVLISARELDYRAIPKAAQTWVNQHLVYTHGYGYTLNPVNRVAPGGLPYYFVQDIGATPTANSQQGLATNRDRLAVSIPINYPRIYYGEITDNYVMTGTRVQELDYPSGNENVYNTYHGLGGIPLGSRWRRWVVAQVLRDWQMLLTRDFTPQSKLLFRRSIKQRIQAIAPFLRYDSNPYLVTAQIPPTPTTPANSSYLYWIIDAYTTSDRYPYADPGQGSFNYIRNSVKVVVDAYNGRVDFYIADPSDPMIQTWAAIFPDLFKPLSALPAPLRLHLRYPEDLFRIQAQQLLIYHMTDPQVFYNREDLWQVATEIYGTKPKLVDPYYLIMRLPTAETAEFILLMPFTPNQRSNMIAWLAARSDGAHYGKLLLYQFPKQQLVYGPEQIEARINQDPLISQQISLWNREGSRVLQGNLLVIPIDHSLLYVEPLYLEAEQNSLPTLARVIIAYENQIVMRETLEQALQAIFPVSPAP